MTSNPNDKLYRLRWNDTGVQYVHPAPYNHQTVFTLAEAMRIAGHEPVTVYDAETGCVLWVGDYAMRGLPGPDEIAPRPDNVALLHRLAAIHHGIVDGFDDPEADFEEIARQSDEMITRLAWELGGKR